MTGYRKSVSAAEKVAFCGIMSALALALSALESMLPPMPYSAAGVKLGLSNIVTMFVAVEMGILPALAVAVIKSGFVALTRGLVAFLMSFAGGVFSTFVMWMAWRSRAFGAVGLGISGAAAHNLAQLFCAVLISGGALVNLLPAILLFSVLTGSAIGIVVYFALPALQRVRTHINT